MPQLQNQIQFQVQFQDQFQFQEQGLQSQKRHITLQENPATPKRRKGQPIAAASRADVVASMANKTAYATHNKIACTLVLQEAAKDREKSLARRTVYHYQQYQRHWVVRELI
ncbi:hypothetical protein BX616_008694 [Lobosporangium transversale]|nr:hypothetical protein BX616_008694 [Lobosporangium transversale]